MPVGNRVEALDGLGPRLDVELDIPAGAVPPGFARWRATALRVAGFAAHKIGSLRDRLYLSGCAGRLGSCSRLESGNVNVGSLIEDTGAL